MSRIQKTLVAGAVLGLLALMVLSVFGDQGMLELMRLREQQQALVHQNETLAAENVNLYRMIGRLKGDPEYIESVARRELGMVGKDDVVIIRSDAAGVRR